MDFFDIAIKNAVNANPVQADDYIGSDGLIYCGKCHTPRQERIELPAFLKARFTNIVPVECECRKAESRRLDELKQRADAEHKRSLCFVDYEMTEWCFANDDGKSDNHAMQVARNYVTNFEKMKADGVGLFIHGDVGVGKSFMAACIANALIDKGENVIVTDFTTIINDLWNCDTRNAYLRKLNDVSLLVIDDLGRENESPHNIGIIASVLDTRCRSKRPLILTSNFSTEYLLKAEDTALRRIYSRIFKQCIPVEFMGIDRRQIQMAKNKSKYHDLLGL